MKVLAKTTGVTLVCTNTDFLDAYKYRLVEYTNQVRDWNNRSLLDIKCFVDSSVDARELNDLGVENFIKKYTKKEEKTVAEPVAEVAAEEVKAPVKKKSRKK